MEKLQRLQDQGIDPYPPRYRRSHTNEEAVALFQDTEARQGPGARSEDVAVAGRVIALRLMGKAAFLDIRDASGRLQVHLRQDILQDRYSLVDDLDLGDFLGVRGALFKTRSGEITLEALQATLLSKALRPPPEKWHGLKDVEIRYRQRYLDLMANAEVLSIFRARSQIISGIRDFLNNKGFIEVETPVLVPVPAGAMAQPFVTRHNALDRTLYLRIATELYLKRLIVGGMDKVYEIGRAFRNEGIDMDHNPEFTMLESYEAYADYNEVMLMLEEMVALVARQVTGSTTVTFHDQ
ncbi:MAG: amino acid--tRNA ligase-related protein, partial [Chloroflexota bacterium]